MFKAAIFDMDELLVDSMLHWLELDKKFFADLGLEFNNEIVRYLSGRSIQESMRYLMDRFNLSQTAEELFKKRAERFMKIYQDKCLPMPGVERLLSFLQCRDWQQAIASGAPLYCIEMVVDKFNWRRYFHHLVSVDHVDQIGKPDPAIYVYAAKRLRVQTTDCVVFEDAENGVVAAKKAGMNCVAVVDKRWSFGNFSQADLVVNSLEDKRVFDYLGL